MNFLIDSIKIILLPPFKFIRKHKAISVIIILVIAGTIFFFKDRFKKEEIKTVAVTRKNLTQTLEVSGEIDALEKVDLHFQAVGKLAWIGVKTGDTVSQWQAIASQDVRSIQKNMKKKLLAYMKERWDFDQSHDDYNTWGTPPVAKYGHLTVAEKRILEQAQFDLDTTVLDVEIQDLSLQIATLVSPIDGIITEIDTPVAGVNVITTDKIQIVNPDTLYFSAEIDEEDIALIHEGQEASIILDAYSDEKISSVIEWIDFVTSTAESGGTVFLVRLTLPDLDAIKYRLGLNGEASIEISKRYNVLTLPLSAIIEQNGQTYVNKFSHNEIIKIQVETGLETDEDIEIVSGLDENDEVVIDNKNGD